MSFCRILKQLLEDTILHRSTFPDAPYRSEINRAVLKLQESGELNRLKKKWWEDLNPKNPCPVSVFCLTNSILCFKIVLLKEELEESGESSAELALSNVGGVFLVLGIGVAVAFVLAILEFLWNVRNVSVEEHVSVK